MLCERTWPQQTNTVMTPLLPYTARISLFTCVWLVFASLTCAGSSVKDGGVDVRNVARAPKLEESNLGHERGLRKDTVGNARSESAWVLWEANLRKITELESKGVMREDSQSETPGMTAEGELEEIAEINRVKEEVWQKSRRLSNYTENSPGVRAIEEALGVLGEVRQEKGQEFLKHLRNTNFSSTVEAKYLRKLYHEVGMPLHKIEKQILIDAGSRVEETVRSASIQRTHVLFAALAAAKKRFQNKKDDEEDNMAEFVSFSSDYWHAYQSEIQDWLNAPYLGSAHEMDHLLDFPIDLGHVTGPGTMDYANRNRKQLLQQELRIQERVRKYNPLPNTVRTADSAQAVTTRAQMTKLYRNSLISLEEVHRNGGLDTHQYYAQKKDLAQTFGQHYEKLVGADYQGGSPLDWASLEDNLDDLQKRSMQAQKEDRQRRMEKLNQEQRRQIDASEERMRRQSSKSTEEEDKPTQEEFRQLRQKLRDIAQRGGSAVDESSRIRNEVEQNTKNLRDAISKKAEEFQKIFDKAFKED